MKDHLSAAWHRDPLASSPPSWRWGSSISRFMARPRLSSGRFARAIFVGLGILYAVTSAIGESRYVEAMSANTMSARLLGSIEAAAIFPLAARIRETNAVLFASANKVPPMIALMEVRRGLKQAPNSPQLVFWLTYQLIRDGDMAQAEKTLRRLWRLAPDWPQTGLVQDIFEAALVRGERK